MYIYIYIYICVCTYFFSTFSKQLLLQVSPNYSFSHLILGITTSFALIPITHTSIVEITDTPNSDTAQITLLSSGNVLFLNR